MCNISEMNCGEKVFQQPSRKQTHMFTLLKKCEKLYFLHCFLRADPLYLSQPSCGKSAVQRFCNVKLFLELCRCCDMPRTTDKWTCVWDGHAQQTLFICTTFKWLLCRFWYISDIQTNRFSKGTFDLWVKTFNHASH